MKEFSYSLLRLLFPIAAMFLLGSVIITSTGKADAAGEFVTVWKTDIENASDKSITIPIVDGLTYDYTVDWGDGNVETNISTNAAHTYTSPGTYTVSISGLFPRLYMNNYADAIKIQSIEAWGVNSWTSMDSAFEGAKYLTINAVDVPNLVGADDFTAMFAGAENLNSDLNGWDVSRATDMAYMFWNNIQFNQDLSLWDVSNVQTFLGMFERAESFNQNINSWDVSGAINMESMFFKATAFNQPLGSWDVKFVKQMGQMLREASSFNQDISSWRVPKLIGADYMFYDATNFNQDISQWDVNAMKYAQQMLGNTNLSWQNYDALLTGWSQDSVRSSVGFSGVPSAYCNGYAGHDLLVDTKNWTITDAGFEPSLCGPTDIIIENEGGLEVEEGSGIVNFGVLGSIDVDIDDTHDYGLDCSGQYPDSAFFGISDGQLVSLASFDYSVPQDADGNNSYEICITSQDNTGYIIEKEFTIKVTEAEEIDIIPGVVLGASTDDISSSSVDGKTAVLGDTSPEVLANTGNPMYVRLSIGLLVLVLGSISIIKTPKLYKVKN